MAAHHCASFRRIRLWVGVLGAVMMVINVYSWGLVGRALTQPERAPRRTGSSVVEEHVGDPVTRGFKDPAQAPSLKVRGDKERAPKGATLVQSTGADATDLSELAPRPMAHGAVRDAGAQRSFISHAETDVALGRLPPLPSDKEGGRLAASPSDRARKTAGGLFGDDNVHV
jgi:hypothetical protein